MDSRTDAEVIACSVSAPAAFGELFDRYATTMFRYLVRRVGPVDADALLGDLFRIAFEKRAAFDTERAEARPWLYGIAGNLLARHRQGEARRLAATARLVNTSLAAFGQLCRGRVPRRCLAAVARGGRRDRHASTGRARRAAALCLGRDGVRGDRIGARRPGRDGAFAASPGAWPAPRTRRRQRGRTGNCGPSPRPGDSGGRRRPWAVQTGEGEAHVHGWSEDASGRGLESDTGDVSTTHLCGRGCRARVPHPGVPVHRTPRSQNGRATTRKACWPGSSSAMVWS